MPSRPRSHSERSASHPKCALAALLPILLLAGAASAQGGGSLFAGIFDPPRAAPDFSLRGSDGAELSLARYRGKVVVLGFGFTSCPDVCPTTLATLARARKKLGPERDELQVLYITVDPERDDAERLRSYLGHFDPTFIGGTGTAEELDSVRRAYGIVATRETLEASYAFAHSSYTFLIDREGALRALVPYGRPPDDYVHDLEILLKQ
jgi:protein SCO1/2